MVASISRAHEIIQKWGTLAFFLDPDDDLSGGDEVTTACSDSCMEETTFVHGAMCRCGGGGVEWGAGRGN